MGLVIPIREGTEIIGILKCNLSILNSVGDLISGAEDKLLGKFKLTRSGGMVVFEEGHEPLSTQIHEDIFSKLKTGSTETLILNDSGEKYLVGLSPIKLTQAEEGYGFGGTFESIDHKKGNTGELWYVICYRKVSVATAQISESFRSIVLISTAIIIILAVVSQLFGRKIANPIGIIGRATEKIGKGNFDHRIEMKRNDEFSKLANSFNAMVHKLQQTTTSNLELDQKVKARTMELEKAVYVAETATRVKGEFLANMSHEIRTPMNAIIGLTHLALKTDLTAQQVDYLEKINGSAKSLLGIINDILDFSKIESGKLDIELINFDLDDVLSNVANIIGLKAEKKGLEVLFSLDHGLHMQLIGDPLRLGQVLLNLGNNAVKFSQSGKIVFSVENLDEQPNKVVLKFSVKDTGIGINKAQMVKIFEGFQQADSTTTRTHGGTGLGLTISKNFVELMGGEIGVESQPGKGSTFSFTLPFRYQTDKTKKYRLPNSDLDGMRILLVDGNEVSKNNMQNFLAYYPFKVACADSAEMAIQELSKVHNSGDVPYGLVLIDSNLAGADSIELGIRIRQTPTFSDLPIIIIASCNSSDIENQVVEAGLNIALCKPVLFSRLYEAILKVFGYAPEHHLERLDNVCEMQDSKNIQGARILLVEDNEINQQIAREMLEHAGIVVTTADNGKKAVENIQLNEYDLVLMDIQMPVMDGYEASQKIRELESAAQSSIPIIAMTAHAMVEHREKSLLAGMNDHLSKPIDSTALFSTLSRWIPEKSKKQSVGRDAKVSVSKVKQAETDLPDALPGIDIQESLARFGGNKSLYAKILTRFPDSQKNTVENIISSLEAGDRETALHHAHTLKGISGNIGASELQKSAEDLENAINAEKKDLKDLISNVSDKLEKTLSGIAQLEQNQTEGLSAETISVDVIDIQKVTLLFDELKTLLEEDNTAAMKKMGQVKEALMGSLLQDEFTAIKEALEKYDFEKALRECSRIRKIFNKV